MIFHCAKFVKWIREATLYEGILKLFLVNQYLIELITKKGLKKKKGHSPGRVALLKGQILIHILKHQQDSCVQLFLQDKDQQLSPQEPKLQSLFQSMLRGKQEEA